MWECCVKQSGKWDNKDFFFLLTKKYIIVATRLLCSIDSMIINLLPLDAQMIQINVSILYANTAEHIVVAGRRGEEKKHANTPFSEEMDNQKGFLLW